MDTQYKIKKLNSLLSTACLILIVVLPATDLFFWANFQQNSDLLNAALNNSLQLATIEPWQIISAALFSIAITLVMTLGLWNLRSLFESFKQAQFFTPKNTQSLYRISKILFLSTVLKCLSSSVISVLLTWNNSAGKKALVVSFGSNELWLLIIAATLLTITWTFREGQRLAQENSEFV